MATAAKRATYLIVDGRNVGPYTDDELRGMIAAGSVVPSAMVWREGISQPVAMSAIPELGHVSEYTIWVYYCGVVTGGRVAIRRVELSRGA